MAIPEKTTAHEKISIYNQEIDFDFLHTIEVKEWLVQIALDRDKTISSLEYILCSDEYLLDINKNYLDHDTYTDIITFPMQESPLEATIYISIERVRENAEIYSTSLIKELHRVMVHGLLHLLGYKDKTENDQSEMRSQEDKALAARAFV